MTIPKYYSKTSNTVLLILSEQTALLVTKGKITLTSSLYFS